ncbi:MAG: hypothetical protein R6V37_03310, partial [Psychroflexus maritimus]
KREKDGDVVVFIANFADEERSFSLDFEGEFTDFETGEQDFIHPEEEMTYPAWGYQILVK